MTLPYRDFYYPLNVFMHILTHEEGAVPYLHYGFFENPGDTMAVAQERSTKLLFSRLPPPPAKILEVGIGLGTTLSQLVAAGYDATGITPDDKQVAMILKEQHSVLPVACVSFELFRSTGQFDLIVFQESSQYIDSRVLFSRAAALTGRVLVLDEFALRDVEGLQSRATFLRAAREHDFSLDEEIDLSAQAAPTIDYFQQRFPRYREALIRDLGLQPAQLDELVEGGLRYRERYRTGDYGYRLLDLRRTVSVST